MADLAIDPHVKPHLVEGHVSLSDVTQAVSSIPEQLNARTPREWYIALAVTGSITLVLGSMLAYLVFTDIGV